MARSPGIIPEVLFSTKEEVPNLAQRCDLCGKAPVSGSNVSHSQRHTKRRFRPNIHPATLTIDGKEQRLKVCTRCLRTHYKSAA